MKRTVLAFSGSPRGAAAIGWLIDHVGFEVVTVTLDVGQGDELAAVRERALALGAVRAHVIDVREELVRDYLLPALQVGAVEQGAALVRPLLAKRLVEVARMEAAPAVAHAFAGGAAAAAIASDIRAIDPSLEVIAPASVWSLSEDDLVPFGRDGFSGRAADVKIDASVWGRRLVARAGGQVSSGAFALTRDADECPQDAAIVEVEFARGTPVRANGIEMSALEMLESLETIAGAHGVGRSTSDGEALEAPAALVLSIAYESLERRLFGDEIAPVKAQLARLYSSELAHGRWFSEVREAIDAFTRVACVRISGRVTLRLQAGQCSVIRFDTADSAAAPDSSKAVA